MAGEATGTLATADSTAPASVVTAPVVTTPAAIVETPAASATPAAVVEAPAKTATELKAEADAKVEADAARAELLKNETPEQKTAREAEEKTAADAKAKADSDKVPEKYELKLPEGMTLQAEITSEFEAAAKEAGLSQERAQALYDIGAKAVQKNVTATQEAIEATQASWLEASKADPEFGGDKLGENMAIAKKALELNPAIKTLLNDSKLGDHPEMIRWMFKVGQKLSEDSFNPAARAAGETKSLADRLYK